MEQVGSVISISGLLLVYEEYFRQINLPQKHQSRIGIFRSSTSVIWQKPTGIKHLSNF